MRHFPGRLKGLTSREALAAHGGTVLATFLSGRVDAHDHAFLTDAPVPLAPSWASGSTKGTRAPEFVQTVRLGESDCEPRLVFEIVRVRGAEPVGTYGADFYAGTPVVNRNRNRDRNRFSEGEAWYVATAFGRPGVDRVVRRILARHDLLGPYADHPAVETATRVAPDGTTLLFLLNHTSEPAHLTAHATATDLLTGKRAEQGEPLTLDPLGVAVLRTQQAHPAQNLQ
ncbi:beta-galactosidase trimerization domain-containing protein [Streptomyces sp. NPDC002845]